MGNTNYTRGRAREYRIIHDLEKRGLVCFRMAGSHGLADIVAIDRKELHIYFIQVKPKSMSKKQKERIKQENSWLDNEFWCKFKVISLAKEVF